MSNSLPKGRMMQAMDPESNLNSLEAKIENITNSINGLKIEVNKSEKFEKFHVSEAYQEFIQRGLFEDEVNKLTATLAMDEHTAESEELILVRLRSLKLVRNYLNGKAESGAVLRNRLAREEKYREELLQSKYGENVDYE